jgi:hypothetical protein
VISPWRSSNRSKDDPLGGEVELGREAGRAQGGLRQGRLLTKPSE